MMIAVVMMDAMMILCMVCPPFKKITSIRPIAGGVYRRVTSVRGRSVEKNHGLSGRIKRQSLNPSTSYDMISMSCVRPSASTT